MAHTGRRLQLSVEQQIGAADVILHVCGELDLATLSQLSAAIERAGAGGPPADHVILDLSGVSFIDAAGLRLLLDSTRRAGPAVILRSPSPPVERLFEVTGLDALMPAQAPEGESSVA